MTTKPPTGLAATGRDSSDDVEDLSDELVVDASQDVTVEASEDSTLDINDEDAITGTETPAPTPAPLFASMETPPPSAPNTTAGYARRGAPTLLGMPHPSMPLPGSSSPASKLGLGFGEDDHDLGDDDDEVTVMARPSVTDDEEEATKVEPAETAIRAAASKDDDDEDELTAALSTQASVERERALRKSMPPSLDVPLSAHSYRAGDSGAEYASSADLADDSDELLADATPGVALDEDDSATGSYSPEADEPSSELEAVLAPRRPTSPAGSSPLGGAGFGASPFSASAPLARTDGFGGRLPTPSAGLGLTLPPSPAAARSFPVLIAPGAGRGALPAHHVARADWVDPRAANPGAVGRRHDGQHRRDLPERAASAGRARRLLPRLPRRRAGDWREIPGHARARTRAHRRCCTRAAATSRCPRADAAAGDRAAAGPRRAGARSRRAVAGRCRCTRAGAPCARAATDGAGRHARADRPHRRHRRRRPEARRQTRRPSHDRAQGGDEHRRRPRLEAPRQGGQGLGRPLRRLTLPRRRRQPAKCLTS